MKPTRKRLLCVGHVVPDADWHLAGHFHHFHELIVVFSGRMRVRLGEQELEAKAGDVLIYPKGVTHEEWTEPTDPAETYFIGFETPHKELLAALPAQSRDLNGRVRQLIGWLYADRELFASSEQLAPEAFVYAILSELQRLASNKQEPLIELIRRHIYENLDQPLTLEDLARVAGMSKFHFLRRYKAMTGRTPMQDVRAIRTESARELILSTNLQMKAIAPRVGLGNVSHLSHMFRKQLNLTPGKLRQTGKQPNR